MSKTVTIRGDEWSEDELRDLASRPRMDVPVKEATEDTPAPAPETAAKPETAEPEAPYVYAHPCPRCGDPVKGGRKDKLCDACRAKSKRERVARSMAKKRAKEAAPAKKSDGGGDGDTVNDSLALSVGTLARRLRRAVYAGDATTYRATVSALTDIDKVITATGGWKEDK